IFIWDTSTHLTSCGSLDSQGNPLALAGNAASGLSADDRYFVFNASGSGKAQVFRRDRTTGVTICVSSDSTGVPGTADSFPWQTPTLSADGRFVVFESLATNLVSGDTNGVGDAFAKD